MLIFYNFCSSSLFGIMNFVQKLNKNKPPSGVTVGPLGPQLRGTRDIGGPFLRMRKKIVTLPICTSLPPPALAVNFFNYLTVVISREQDFFLVVATPLKCTTYIHKCRTVENF